MMPESGNKIFEQYRLLGQQIRDYISHFGGFVLILSSPYLVFSILLSLLMYGQWSKPNWWDTPISVIPNLTGFALAGFAIYIGLINNRRFFDLLQAKEPETGKTVFSGLGFTFFHFIFLQVFALLIALVAKARILSTLSEIFPLLFSHRFVAAVRPIVTLSFWAIAHAIFIYSIVTLFALLFAVVWAIDWYEKSEQASQKPTCRTD
jgi:hypothetical protein